MSRIYTYSIVDHDADDLQKPVVALDLDKIVAIKYPQDGSAMALVQTTAAKGMYIPYEPEAFEALLSAWKADSLINS